MEIQSRTQLIELMKHLGLPLVAVEVGVAEGIFASELYSLGLEKLYLVDVWEQQTHLKGCASLENAWHENNFLDVLRRFKDKPNVILLKGLSQVMADKIADNSLGLVYVDGDHTYEGVMADIKSYLPKLVNGGIMAFHDYMNHGYGVNKAVNEFTKGEGVVVLKEDADENNWGAYFIKK